MLTRRMFLLAFMVTAGGCKINTVQPLVPDAPSDPALDRNAVARYAALTDEPFPVPAIDVRKIDPKYLRREVSYSTALPPGTIVVDPQNYFLYLIQPHGRAIRYGVGVGRENFGWSGSAIILRKSEWPTWTPPTEMIARDPNAAPWAKGMPGGPRNPLGARALYLYQNGRDTLYRIHGTLEPRSIGKSMSSGCIRLLNQDVIDLYRRVPIGSRTVILPSDGVRPSTGSPASQQTSTLSPNSVDAGVSHNEG